MAIKLFVQLIFIVATAIHCNAAVTISSINVDTGVISGEGFGVHADYGTGLPHLIYGWLDWENGNLDKDGYSTSSDEYDALWTVVSGGLNRTGSNYYARHFNTSSEPSNITGLRKLEAYSGNEVIFISWYYLTPASTGISGKHMRMRFNQTSGENLYLAGTASHNGMFAEVATRTDYTGYTFPNNSWRHLYLEVDLANNTQKFWVLENGSTPINSNAWVFTPDADFENIISSGIDGAGAGSETTHNASYDDVYISKTRARVEICNKSTWAEVWDGDGDEVCEAQIPTAWTSTSITVDVNQGAHDSLNNKYIYIVDSAGAVNANGCQIQLNPGSHRGMSISGGMSIH